MKNICAAILILLLLPTRGFSENFFDNPNTHLAIINEVLGVSAKKGTNGLVDYTARQIAKLKNANVSIAQDKKSRNSAWYAIVLARMNWLLTLERHSRLPREDRERMERFDDSRGHLKDTEEFMYNFGSEYMGWGPGTTDSMYHSSSELIASRIKDINNKR